MYGSVRLRRGGDFKPNLLFSCPGQQPSPKTFSPGAATSTGTRWKWSEGAGKHWLDFIVYFYRVSLLLVYFPRSTYYVFPLLFSHLARKSTPFSREATLPTAAPPCSCVPDAYCVQPATCSAQQPACPNFQPVSPDLLALHLLIRSVHLHAQYLFHPASRRDTRYIERAMRKQNKSSKGAGIDNLWVRRGDGYTMNQVKEYTMYEPSKGIHDESSKEVCKYVK